MSTAGLNTREPQLILRPLRGFEPTAASELRNRLIRFEYETTIKAIDVARFEFDNTDGALMSLESIALGVALEVQWGYVGAQTLPRLVVCKKMKGMAGDRNHGGGRRPVRESLGGQGKVLLECWAKTQALHRLGIPSEVPGDDDERGPRAFTAMRLSDIVREIARAYDVKDNEIRIEIPPFDPIRPFTYVPVDETHAQFLQRQADLLGWVFFVDETGFHFHSPEFDRTPKVTLSYFAGEPDMRNYEFEGDFSFNAPNRMHGRGIDASAYQVRSFETGVIPEAGDPTGTSGTSQGEDPEVGRVGATGGSLLGYGRVVDDVVSGRDVFTLTAVHLRGQNVAVRKLIAHARKKWKFKAELVGHPYLFAKQWFTLRNISSLADGDWYAYKVTHKYEAGGVYTTHIEEARRDKPHAAGTRRVHGDTEIVPEPGEPANPNVVGAYALEGPGVEPSEE